MVAVLLVLAGVARAQATNSTGTNKNDENENGFCSSLETCWSPALFGVIMLYVIGTRIRRRGNNRTVSDSESSLASPGAQ